MWWGVCIIVFHWDSYMIPMTFNLISLFTLTFWCFCFFYVRSLLWWQSPWYHVECIWGKLYFSTCLRFGLKSDQLFWDREALQMRHELSVYPLLLLWSQSSLCQSLSQLLWFVLDSWWINLFQLSVDFDSVDCCFSCGSFVTFNSVDDGTLWSYWA